MLNTTELILRGQLGERVIRDRDLAQLFGGSKARRYGLVNKAIKAKELVPLHRGLYLLHARHRKTLPHPFYLANHCVPFSYITEESALSFHGWIPERITEIVSAAYLGRSKVFDNPYGRFSYRVMPAAPYEFLTEVEVIDLAQNQTAWVATPLRALVDYVFTHKLEDVRLEFLKNSLRIEEDHLLSISLKDIQTCQNIYASKRVKQFLKNVEKELYGPLNHRSAPGELSTSLS